MSVVLERTHAGSLAELEPWLDDLRATGSLVRHVRGDRMRTKPETFAELGTALQFPLWCGVTWDGLYDVLVTEAGLSMARGLDLVVLHAQHLLADEPLEQSVTFREVFEDVARAWGEDPDGAARRLGPATTRVHLVRTTHSSA